MMYNIITLYSRILNSLTMGCGIEACVCTLFSIVTGVNEAIKQLRDRGCESRNHCSLDWLGNDQNIVSVHSCAVNPPYHRTTL